MNGLTRGSFLLARIAGINVFVHWSWAVVAYLQIVYLKRDDSSLAWSAAEYLSLFGIVLLHEFGHSLACRQVGGTANRIVLWPLGGVAFVSPPLRPGAWLWSIAAGPLVNLVLLPITVGFYLLAGLLGWLENPDLHHFVLMVTALNVVCLVFNMLPIYPLDGGQILQALLWYVMGRGQSLLVASCVGLISGAALIVVAVLFAGWWLGIVAAFITLRSWVGIQQAWALLHPKPGMALLDQASEHLQKGEFSEALAACNSAAELVGDNRVARANLVFRRGLAHRALGEVDRAVADFTVALELFETPALYLSRAEAHAARSEYDLALYDLDEVLHRDPWSAASFQLRGDIYLHQGQYTSAIAEYTRALRLDPQLAVAWANRASAHHHLGHDAEASADYQEALKLGFEMPPVAVENQPDV